MWETEMFYVQYSTSLRANLVFTVKSTRYPDDL